MSQAGSSMLERLMLLGGSPAAARSCGLNDFAQEVLCPADVDSALELLERCRPNLVIVSEGISPDETLRLLGRTCLKGGDLPVVVVTKKPSVELAVKFVRAGALDYLQGPLRREHLCKLLEGMEMERSRAAAKLDCFFSPQCPPGVAIVGKSEGIVKALEMIRIVAESRCNPVLILGETGTGKELAAQAVHAWRSGEAEKFVAINCAALTANLLESELFGHVKGAFTGADRDKTGLFALADDGTILLDEISEMPVDLQAKLLRVLQERTFRKVGGTKNIHCNATVVVSSNRDLSAEVEAGRFRRDLYYRLTVFPIKLPSLRSPQRRVDIPLLAEYFLGKLKNSALPAAKKLSGFSDAALKRLSAHDWPGNVRELRNVVERAVILADSGNIKGEHLIIETPAGRRPQEASAAGRTSEASNFSLETAEREFILRALRETGWQRTRAAALLGITRATLHAKLKRYGIKPPARPGSIEGTPTDSHAESRRI